MVTAQCHKKGAWQRASPNRDRQSALNWRLDPNISTGLMGEIGIHQLDQCCWFLAGRPNAITGFRWLTMGDEGIIRAIFEYPGGTLGRPGGLHLDLDITMENSHGGCYETYYRDFGTILMRENRTWLFKEADANLYGFEVYCRREKIFDETGIVMGPDEEHSPGSQTPKEPVDPSKIALSAALKAFVANVRFHEDAIRAFVETYGKDEPDALTEHIKKHVSSRLEPVASALDGFRATVMAIKSNEAILSRQRMEFKDEWFQLS